MCPIPEPNLLYQNSLVPPDVLRPSTLSTPSIDVQDFAAMVTGAQARIPDITFPCNLRLPTSTIQPLENAQIPTADVQPQPYQPDSFFTVPPQGIWEGFLLCNDHDLDRALAYDLGLQAQVPQAEFTVPAATNTNSTQCNDHVRL